MASNEPGPSSDLQYCIGHFNTCSCGDENCLLSLAICNCSYCTTKNTDLDRALLKEGKEEVVASKGLKASSFKKYTYVPEVPCVKGSFGQRVNFALGSQNSAEARDAITHLIYRKPGTGRHEEKDRLQRRLAARIAAKEEEKKKESNK